MGINHCIRLDYAIKLILMHFNLEKYAIGRRKATVSVKVTLDWDSAYIFINTFVFPVGIPLARCKVCLRKAYSLL